MRSFLSFARNLQCFNSIKFSIAQNHHHQALKASLSLSSPLFTDQIYALFLKSGHSLDPHLATTLITHFSKSGDFSRSLQFLFDAQPPDIVSFNALLSGYAQFHLTPASFSLYWKLTCSGLVPDQYTLSSLIKSCDRVLEIEIAHVICTKFGLNSTPFLVSGLVGKYAKCGCLESAAKCFRECLVSDVVVWTAMVNGCAWNGEFLKAREVFVEMRGLGLEVNEFSLTSVLGALWDVEDGEQVHGLAVKMGFFGESSNHLSNALISMYCRCGRNGDAVKVFDEITEPDIVSWTARIGAACYGEEALEEFNVMRSRNLEVNELTLINVLSAIEGPKLLGSGRQVHLLCYKMGYSNSMVVSVSNALVSMYGKCGMVKEARLAFDEMVCRDSISWNSLIGGYAGNGLIGPAIMVFSWMRSSCVEPDKYTMASILDIVSNSSSVKLVMQIHVYLIKIGFMSDDSMLCCLITSYGKCNSVDEAKKVFCETEMTNVGHLQVLASGAVNTGCPAVALELFSSTRSSFIELDCVLLSIVLKACGVLTNLRQGMAIHSLALKSGIGRDSFLESAIVDMYCKCGHIADAEKSFRDVCLSKLAACNAMIMGYAQHGRHQEVLRLFKAMTEFDVKPDEITYLGLLNSCSHAGLIKEAQDHLSSMLLVHGVAPCLEHYSCIIDLFGRVGLVEEAKRTIDQMPMSPDAQIWQSLLSSCSIYGKLDLGKVAARELLKLQPENDSAYVLLSSLHAKAGEWEAAGRLRREMKEKAKHKEPGYSWVELGGCMSYFLADDASHPMNYDIYLNLASLYQHILPLFKLEEDSLSIMDF
ncbi:hypothetical protein Dimus_008634 [Dionaea muscipula]